MMRRSFILIAFVSLFAIADSRPPDIPFQIEMIDPGASETAAVADINHDGHLDIVSGEYWYEGPTWKKHKFRNINFTGNYIDNFADLPIDVNGDGYPDIVSVSWFAKKISWWKNPGKSGGPWLENLIDSGNPIEFAFLVDLTNSGKKQDVIPEWG
ncbi:MAG TPA: VCBS repeat-containing protein, partial [Candidatus Acidoferrales bacterium]